MLVYPVTFFASEDGGNDSNTVVLLHMNGSDAATTFTNSALGGSTSFTATGNAQIDTADSKFGGASGLFDGTGDYLTFDASSADFSWAGDFTIDFWMKTNVQAEQSAWRRTILATKAAAAGTLVIAIHPTSGAITFSNGNPQTTTIITGTTDVADNTWRHVAVTRTGSTNRLFIDGTQEGGDASDSTSWTGSNAARLGSFQTTVGDYGTGWLDEFRISKGVARWTSNFTPPTVAYS